MAQVGLSILLVLTLLSIVLCTVSSLAPSGPEGPVGAWIALIFPFFFITAILTICIFQGRLDWIPGGRLVQLALLPGALVAFAVAFFAAFDANSKLTSILGHLAPYCILAGCAIAVYASGAAAGRIGIAALLGAPAIAGWVIVGVSGAHALRERARAVDQASVEEEAREKEYEAQEVAQYRSLPADATLSQLLPCTYSRNAAVMKECQDRIAALPNLDEELMTILAAGKNEDAVRYVARVYPGSTAKFAPAYAKMLEFQLKVWDVLQYDEYAGKWEPNLSKFFEGADRIQKAGGDLKPQLRVWYELLRKSKGLGGLAAYVKRML